MDQVLCDHPDLDTPHLDAEQAGGVRKLLTSGKGCDLVIGQAGTGKSTMLRAARIGWESAGFKVFGAAVAARTAADLEVGTGIPQLIAHPGPRRPSTVRRAHLKARGGDRRGLHGRQPFPRPAPLPRRWGRGQAGHGRDNRQLSSIDVGGALRTLASELGPHVVTLTTNRRQNGADQQWEREALVALRRGDVAPVVQAYVDHGGVTITGTIDEARQRLVDDWWAVHLDHKPVVEGSVRFVANHIGAVLRDRRFVGLAELNEAIFDLVAEINARPFQKREDSRRIVFERDEKSLLNPLPAVRFELADLRKGKVAPNYHLQIDRNFYSVPARLLGQSLDVRVTSASIEVFDGGERVACHARLVGVRGRYSTVTAHMPEGHRRRLTDWTPQRFETWAATIGPNTLTAIQAILASRKIVEQSYRSCLGVMSLAKRPGGMGRLEDSCGRALDATPAPSYTLIKKLWSAWKPTDPPPPASLGDAGFVRGAGYYSGDGGQA